MLKKTSSPQFKIVHWAVFFRNDRPEGFGFGSNPRLRKNVTFEQSIEEATKFVSEVIPLSQNFINSYKKLHPNDTLDQYLNNVFAQCEEIAETSKVYQGNREQVSMENELQMMCIGFANVNTLVQFGRIPNDEYNGVVIGALDAPFSIPKLKW